MKINYSVIHFYLFTSIFLAISCTQEKAENMVYLDYYYDFKDFENSSLSSKAIRAIQQQINGKSYVITNNSGKQWPFYVNVEDPENFPADSILFPHPGLHRFSPLDNYKPRDGRHFKITTTFYQVATDTVKMKVVVYEKNTKETSWKILVDAIIKDFPRKHYKTEEGLIQFIEENIILISFK